MSKEADPNSETRLISVNGKVYAVQIVPAESIFNHNANSHTVPQALSPSPLPPSPCAAPRVLSSRPTIVATTTQQFTEQVRLLLWLLAGISAIALLVAFIVRLLVPATPLPLSPVPQTVIVQPPPPEKHRYRREQCEPAGLFGWGKTCRQEEGWE